MKKNIILGITLLLVFLFAGCKIQLRGPDLSFEDYNITENPVTETETIEYDDNGDGEIDRTEEVTNTIGYTYNISGTIKNDSGEGKYYLEVYGDGVKIGSYGPVSIGLSETKTFNLTYETNTTNRREKFEIKLYAIDYYGNKSLQETVEYSVNI